MSMGCAPRQTAPSEYLDEAWAQDAVDHPLQNIHHCTAVSRMVRLEDPEDEILVYTDGSCLDQNSFVDNSIRRAGCAVIFGTKRPRWDPNMHSRAFMFALEQHGPTGEFYPPTSNRAELRAAIAALECREWSGEGWSKVVIATDSAYVVEGITYWVLKWREQDFQTKPGKPVKNRDLWERLLQLVNEHCYRSVLVCFMRIPRHCNEEADKFAKEAAKVSARSVTYNSCNLNKLQDKPWE